MIEQFQLCYLNLAITPDEVRDDVEKYSKGPFFNVKAEDLEKISDVMFEDFLNDVFGDNSRLDRD